MLTIRLFRFGTKNSPTFRVAVSPKHKDTHGNYIEVVGHYNPRSNPKIISLNAERIKYWLGNGAQPSTTVHNLLVSQGIIDAKKKRAYKLKKKEQASEEQPQAAPKVAAQ